MCRTPATISSCRRRAAAARRWRPPRRSLAKVFRSSHVRSGLKTVHTSRVVRKTTTMTRGEQSQLAIEQEATTQAPRLLESSATQTRSERRRGHKVRKATGCALPVRDRRRAMASSGGRALDEAASNWATAASFYYTELTRTTKRPDSDTGRRRVEERLSLLWSPPTGGLVCWGSRCDDRRFRILPALLLISKRAVQIRIFLG
ncbi:hypothetical protein MRX96_030228 [Rhipicephalus microplus]